METRTRNVYQVTLTVVDLNEQLQDHTVCELVSGAIERRFDVNTFATRVDRVSVDWHDRHPLNFATERHLASSKLFGDRDQLVTAAAAIAAGLAGVQGPAWTPTPAWLQSAKDVAGRALAIAREIIAQAAE